MKSTSNNMKRMFMEEIKLIHNDKLRKLAKQLVKTLPEYFWIVPASSSGKYHPACDLGDGGLVRHSIMVSRCAVDLVISEVFVRDNQINMDLARFTALFHDCLKHGLVDENGNYSSHTVFEHPILAAYHVRQFLTLHNVDDLTVNTICDSINSHMGKWNTSKYSKQMLSTPQTDFEKLIHVADYVASRKYIGGLEEWNSTN